VNYTNLIAGCRLAKFKERLRISEADNIVHRGKSAKILTWQVHNVKPESAIRVKQWLDFPDRKKVEGAGWIIEFHLPSHLMP
jgi:hypothetical protein